MTDRRTLRNVGAFAMALLAALLLAWLASR
jgi:hypothetical protein